MSDTAVHHLGKYMAGLGVGRERGRELVPLPDLSDLQTSLTNEFLIQRYAAPATLNAVARLQRLGRVNYEIITATRKKALQAQPSSRKIQAQTIDEEEEDADGDGDGDA
jgi:hypothetical protein